MDQSTNPTTKLFVSPVRTAFGFQPDTNQAAPAPAATPATVAVPQVQSADQIQPSISQPVFDERTLPSVEAMPPQETLPETAVDTEPIATTPSEQAEPEVQTPASNIAQDQFVDQFQDSFQEELLYQWEAPSRPFKKRNRQYFMTVLTIAILLCLILFFAGQFLPVAVVIAVAFLAYIMAAIPPQLVMYQLTTFGIRIEDELYYWEEIGRFWYDDVHSQRVLYFEIDRFPFRLSLVLSELVTENELTNFLQLFLMHERPLPTVYEKAANWLQKKLPLDIES